MRAIREHVQSCTHCQALLDEVNVIDALLETATVPDLPQNFTFAVMAEMNSQPPPRVRAHPVWSFLALYSAAAWVAVVLGLALSGTSPRVVIAGIGSMLGRLGVASDGFSANVAQGLSGTIPGLAAFGVGVLIIDIAIACAFALLYFVVRPRLAARLASFTEAS